jgi:hypothetical protein
MTCACVSVTRAQEMEIPVEMQFTLFEKILSFNRADHSTRTGEYVIGILYQKNVRASVAVAEAVSALPHALAVNGKKVRFQLLPLGASSDLEQILTRTRPDALYVAPLRSADIDMIAGITRQLDILTMTGVPAYVDDGLSVGLALKSDRPQVCVNLASAKAEGADFSSKLLNIAKVIH